MKKFMFSLILIFILGSLSAQTIGNNSEGTSSDYPSNAMCAIRYQCTQNMTVDKMYLKIAASGTGYIKCAIYSDNGGKPGTFLMGTNQLTNPGTGWKSFTLTSGLALSSGTWYHLVFWTNNTGFMINYSTSGATTFYKYQTYGAWPTSYGTENGSGTSPYCIYATTSCINPTITAQPLSISRNIGTSATFNVTATGTSLTYQWRKNGSNITGATASGYTINPVGSSDAANYSVVVSGACGSPVTSSTATLTVNSTITLGNYSEGTLNDSPSDAMCAARYQCMQNMTATIMYLKVANSGSGRIKCAIYSDNGGNPGTFLMGTNELTNPGTGWKSFTLTSGLALTSGTWYHLVCWTDGTGYTIYYSTSGANTNYKHQTYGAWPSTYGTADGSETSPYCVYVTGTSSMIPSVTTTTIINITTNSASSGGNVTSDGGAAVTVRGVCWSTTTNPTIANSKTSNGTGTGTFTSSITGLSQNTTYHVRAYATNSVGTSYGSDIQFTTTGASGTILGNNSEGNSSDSPSDAMCAARYQCTQNMTATTMNVKVATSGSGKIKCAIYSDNSGIPGTFLMGTNELTNPGTGWQSFTLTSGLALTSGTWYHLVCWTDGTGYTIYYSTSGANTNFKHQTYGAWPSMYGTADGSETSPYCVYVTGSGQCTSPSITAQPKSLARAIGESATFSVTATGTGLTYQWRKNGSNISGQTLSSYTINNVASTDAAAYTVVVSGSCGSPVTSNTASLTVGKYFVSTSGNDNNPGTFSQPFATWQKGFDMAVAGDIVYIRGGIYTPNPTNHSGVSCGVYASHSGTSAGPITISAYPGEVPVLDGAKITQSGLHFGIWMQYCDYWNLTGLWVRNILEYYNGGSIYSPSSYNYAGSIQVNDVSHITFTRCTVSGSGEGFEVGSNSDYINYTNCDAFNNYDKINRGDYCNGFGGTISAGKHVSHTGCRSWNNSDDGYDYAGSEGGYITWDNCWSFLNGYTWYSNGTFVRDINGYGDGVGYKVTMCTETSKESGPQRILRKCLSFNNLTASFDDSPANTDDPNGTNYNVSRQEVDILNCTSYNNGYTAWMNFNSAGAVDRIQNCIAFSDDYGADISANSTNNHNTWNTGFTVSSSDFLSLDTTGVTGPRQADGSLPVLNFLKLNLTSGLIGAGIDVGLPYLGYNPDLGAYESNNLTKSLNTAGKPNVISETSGQKEETFSLVIYPNPVKDNLNVSVSGNEGLLSLKLFNSGAVKVFEGTVPGDYVLDMSSYPSGIYFLHATIAGKLIIKKVVKY